MCVNFKKNKKNTKNTETDAALKDDQNGSLVTEELVVVVNDEPWVQTAKVWNRLLFWLSLIALIIQWILIFAVYPGEVGKQKVEPVYLDMPFIE